MRGRANTQKFFKLFLATGMFSAAIFFAMPKIAGAAGSFSEKFNKKSVINETGSMDESASPDWWVNSGGQMIFNNKGVGQTVQKNLSKNSKWCKLYKEENAEDTDGGKHPQNIFRLLTRTRWQNFTQQAYFKIKKTNLSSSENRNESNGLLLFNRYQDSDNLYYAGVRVDGYAVIKKKMNGEYFTLDYKKIYSGKKYSRKSRPNLLPKNKGISLKTEVENADSGKVEIKLYVANGSRGDWTLAAAAVDEPGKYGGGVIAGEGYAGIRTDFMDVEFDKYRIEEN